MKIGFFGGTFNPPHNGHINLARHWSDRLSLDKFLIIPTGTPPHKEQSDVSGEMRLEMCSIAARESGGLLEVSDFEVRRGVLQQRYIYGNGRGYVCDARDMV